MSSEIKSMGVEIISNERQRQIEQYKFNAEHDAGHTNEALASAAACYAMPPQARLETDIVEKFFPWDKEWWKPDPKKTDAGRIRELAKSGALAAAEIDRIIAHNEKCRQFFENKYFITEYGAPNEMIIYSVIEIGDESCKCFIFKQEDDVFSVTEEELKYRNLPTSASRSLNCFRPLNATEMRHKLDVFFFKMINKAKVPAHLPIDDCLDKKVILSDASDCTGEMGKEEK